MRCLTILFLLLLLLLVLTLTFTTTALSSLTTPDLIPFIAITVVVLGLFLLVGAIYSGGVDMVMNWLEPAAAVLVVLCVIGVLVLVWKISKGGWRFLRRGGARDN